jgi:translocation and assembly module TamB
MSFSTATVLKRFTVGIVGFVVSVIGVLLAFGAFVVSTQTGTRFALAEAQSLRPRELHIGKVNGRLLGPLRLRDVDLNTQTAHIHLDRGLLKWSPGALFGGVVKINRLAFEGVTYTAHPPKTPPPPSKPYQLPKRLNLPMSVVVKQASLKNLKYYSTPKAKKPFVLNTLTLAAGVSNRNVYIKDLALHGPQIDARGGLHTRPYGAYKTASLLRFEYRLPGYAPVKGRTRLSGGLKSRLRVHQSIAAPYNIKANVKLADLFGTPHFDAALGIDGMQLQAVHGKWPADTLSATGNSRGTSKNLTYGLKASLAQAKLKTLNASLNGNLKSKIVNIQDLTLAIAQHPARLHGHGQVNIRNPKQPALDLHFNWVKLRYPLAGPPTFTSPKGTVDLTGTLQHLLAKLDIAVGDDGRVYGQAKYSQPKRKQKSFNVALNWRDLKYPVQQPARFGSPHGRMTFAGTMAHYALKVDAAMTAPKQTNGHLIVRGTGDKNSMTISRIDMKALDGTLKGTAEAAWKPAVKGSIDLTGKGINTGLVNPKWPGTLALDLKASGARHGKALSATIPTLKVTGKLRGNPVALNGVLDYTSAGLDLKTFTLRSGSTHLAASGHASKQTADIGWTLNSDNLASLLPGAAGQLHGHGHVSGPIKRPHVVATLSGSGIRYAQDKLARLNLDADLDLQGKSRSHLNFTLANAAVGTTKIKKVALKGHGTPASHTFTLTADSSKGQAEFALDGHFKDAVENFALTRARLKYPKLKAWTLVAPGKGQISKKAFALSNTCWQAAPAKLCLKAKRTTKLLTAAFSLKDLKYGYLAKLMPKSTKVTGGLSASGQVEKPANGTLAAKFALDTTAGRIATKTSQSPKPVTVLHIKPSQVRLDLGKQGMNMRANLNLGKQGGMTMTGHVPGGSAPFKTRPINAHLKAKIRNLGFLAKLSPMVKSLSGRLNGNLNISGLVKAPKLQGRLALTKGAAVLPGPGLDLRHVRFAMIGQGNGGLALKGHAQSGGGAMNIRGNANFLGKTKRLALNINGKRFLAADNAMAHVYISPNLNIALNGSKIKVRGKVAVPQAKITPKKIPKGAVAVSSDQVIVKPGKKQKTAAPKSVDAKVRLILGKDVHFEGFGAKMQLQGNLLAISEPGQPVLGNGEFDIVKGEYRAYGQGLVIDRGQILWAGGPIEQPAVSIRALRHPGKTSAGNNVTVGVDVEGTLKKPKFTLFSDPPMTQAEQLSWLVLGQPLKSTSGGQSNVLADAALGLGITGGNALAKKLKQGIGVDTLGIKTGSGEAGAASNNKQASLVIGKYLTPKLYVSYGIGLFQPISTVTLDYLLSSKWKIQTESSRVGTGGDVIYTIETK